MTHTPDMSAEAVYDAWHARHTVDAEANAPWHRMIRRRLDPTREVTGCRVLEIGSGLGGFACWLASHRPVELVAADFSPVAVEKGARLAADRGFGGIAWTVADIQNLSRFGPEFDTVFSCETIEHIPEPPSGVRELARVLKPGGRLYLTTPNYLGTIGLYRAYCWVRGKPFDEGGQPICQLTMLPKTRAWVRAAGLKIVTAESCGHYLPFPGRPPIEMMTIGRPQFILKWFGLHSLVVAEKACR
jgi:2-polyprenyl-3-methyl-5-hydroxy-6-metoxy-1,4-benzoquinol methylase